MSFQDIIRRFNITQLLYAGFALIILLVVTMTIQIWGSNSKILKTTNEIRNDDVPGVILYLQLLDELGDMQSNALEYLAGEEEEKLDFQENYQEFIGYLNKLKPLESKIQSDITKMEFIDSEIKKYAQNIEQRVFNTYNPEVERWAYKLVTDLENNEGKELETLLDRLKEEEFSDALKSKDLRESLKDDLPGVRYYLELIDETGDMLSSIRTYITGDLSKRQAFDKDVESFNFYFNKLVPLEKKPQEIINLKRIKSLESKIVEGANQVFEKFNPSGRQQAITAVDTLEHDIFSKLEKIMDESAVEESTDASRALDNTHANISALDTMLAFAMPLSAILGFIIALSISTAIKRRLNRINSVLIVADKISDGDLTESIKEVKGSDEISRLARAINRMNESLRDIIKEVGIASSSILGSSSDIQAISTNSSEKCTDQEEKSIALSSAIEEMSATANEVANQSASAFKNAKESSAEARNGSKIVKSTIAGINDLSQVINAASDSVDELGKRSSEISEIITVINAIAEQTNLLALNAAIEAARAGEAGRGFAVVADEVRSLAARTTEATTQVSDSIGSIQSDTKTVIDRISKGTEQAAISVDLAEQAGSALTTIENAFMSLNSMIESIASSAQEQSKTAAAMAQDVTHISSLASDVALISKEVTTKSQDMEQLSVNLNTSVGRFNIGKS